MAKQLKHFHDRSLRPPHLDPPDVDHRVPASSCLLDLEAYISDLKNSSTAYCSLKRNRKFKIQVTFVTAPPPSVSYFCVFCPKVPHNAFATEPRVIAMEANLALIRLVFGEPSNRLCAEKYEYFLYQAPDGDVRAPSLKEIPRPKPFAFFENYQVGLLPSHPGLFYIAALPTPRKATDRQLSFYLFNSETDSWSTKTASLDGNGDNVDLCSFRCTKVMTIGRGSSGVVAWVDLCRGLLYCDVLHSSPKLRYTPLPSELCSWDPWSIRDIAVIQGRIKFVDLDFRTLGLDPNGVCIADGWTADVWSRKADEDDWHKEFSVDSNFVSADLELLGQLPKLHDTRGRLCEPTLLRLHVGQPTLSLEGDPIVYLMAKRKLFDDDAWVLAIDMTGNGKLKALTPFVGAERRMGINFIYVHSRISEHLNLDPPAPRKKYEELENEGEASNGKQSAGKEQQN